MPVVFLLGLFAFVAGIANIIDGDMILGVGGVLLGTGTMITSLLAIVWPAPKRHCGHDGRCCRCGLWLSRSVPVGICQPNGRTERQNIG